jgi:anthranilate/para-aminobenzoate synthase component I
VSIGTGGAITFCSAPADEVAEIMLKLRALVRTVARVTGRPVTIDGEPVDVLPA